MKYDTLLTIDGGGLRNLMSNQILKQVEKSIKEYFLEHPELLPEDAGEVTSIDDLEVHLADFFDCIASVSAGSWVALYYASKGGNGAAGEFLSRPEIVSKYGEFYAGSAAGLDVFFQEFAGRIYPQGLYYRLPTIRFDPYRVAIPGLNSPRYPSSGLEEALRSIYGETKMSELGTNCIVNAYDTDHRNPLLFTYNNAEETPSATSVRSRSAIAIGAPSGQPEQPAGLEPSLDIHYGQDFRIVDVARASSAVPAFHIGKEVIPVNNDSISYMCIDGGLGAPNPTLHAMNFLLRMQGDLPDVFKIATMTVGAGFAIGDYSQNIGRGVLGWMLTGDLLEVIAVSGSESLVSNLDYLLYNALNFPRDQFFRIQVIAHEGTPEAEVLGDFDDITVLDDLMRIGENAAQQRIDDIKLFLEKFVFAPET